MFVWTFSGVFDAIVLGLLLTALLVCGSILLLQKAWRKVRRALRRRPAP